MMVHSGSLSQVSVQEFSFDRPASFLRALRQWTYAQNPAVFLDSNGQLNYPYRRYDALVAVGAQRTLRVPAASNEAFTQWEKWQAQTSAWQFGYLTYDLKNEIEDLQSAHPDHLAFPVLHFFEPEIVVEVIGDRARIHSIRQSPTQVWASIQAILQSEQGPSSPVLEGEAKLKARLSKKEYLETIQHIREHIIEGDIYEMNFCQEFYLEEVKLNPTRAFERLNAIGQAPFSSYFRVDDQYILCASPERFLAKRGKQIISQPIKGTRPRHADPVIDQSYAEQLLQSEKDRAENVMIVDLVRNDFARSCQPGSVQVEELFGIYSFELVHQMISTVTGTLRPEVSFLKALKAAFPMGSMTGAPKVMTMQLIEQYERSRRGVYSGAIGYIRPDGDADFNVVIRSLLYNASKQYLSFQVGGAIVYDSQPEEEYTECLVKAKGLLETLGLPTSSF
ncbi:MAG: chorismate-binding protein [Bacteroidota bacterium]